MWWLLACAGGVASGARSAESFFPPWAAEARFRPIAAPDAAPDTAAVLTESWTARVSGGGPWRWTLVDGEDPDIAPELVTLDLDGSDGLVLKGPELLLLPDQFADGEQVAEGATNVTVVVHKDVPTWYGVIPEAVEIQMVGAVSGFLFLAPGIGPVKFSLEAHNAELAWYR